MKKHIRGFFLSAAVLILSALHLSAQEPPMAESPATEYKKEFQIGFFGEDETGVYYSKMDQKDGNYVVIEKRDPKTMALLNTYNLRDFKDIKSQEKPNVAVIGFGFMYSSPFLWSESHVANGKTFTFTVFFDKKNDTMQLLLQTVSPKGEISPPYSVLSIPTRNSYTSAIIKFSPDSKSFFVVANPESWAVNPFDPYGKPKVSLNSKLYDSETLNLIWQKDLGPSVKELSYNASGFTIDNDHNLFYFTKEEKVKQLAIVTANSPTIKRLSDLVPEGRKLQAPSIKVLSDGTICYSAVTSDISENEKGFCPNPALLIRILSPKDFSFKLSQEIFFPAEVTDKLTLSKSDVRKPDPLLVARIGSPYREFLSPEVFIQKDGSYVIYTQDVFHDTFAGRNRHKESIVSVVAANGTLSSTIVIPGHYMVYNMFKPEVYFLNDKLYFLSYEDIGFAGKAPNEYDSSVLPLTAAKGANITLFSVDDQKVSKRIVFFNKEKDFMLKPDYCKMFVYSRTNALILAVDHSKLNQLKYLSYSLTK